MLVLVEGIFLLPSAVELFSYFQDHDETHTIIHVPDPGGDLVPVEIGSQGLMVYFILLVIVIWYSLIYFMRNGGLEFFSRLVETLEIHDKFSSAFSSLRDRKNRGKDDSAFERNRSAFLTTVSVFTALMSFQVLYIVFLVVTGVDFQTPGIEDWPRWKQMFALARASVLEEIVFRIILLGVPLTIYHTYGDRKGKEGRSGTGTPGSSKEPRRGSPGNILGGWNSVGVPELSLIFATGLLFGLAHIFLWDLWKVPPTLVAGLGFGYLYIKRGVFPCIVLHFAVDYLSIPALFLGGYAQGAYFSFVVLAFLVFMLTGLFEFDHYLRGTAARLADLARKSRIAGK